MDLLIQADSSMILTQDLRRQRLRGDVFRVTARIHGQNVTAFQTVYGVKTMRLTDPIRAIVSLETHISDKAIGCKTRGLLPVSLWQIPSQR